MDEAIYVTTLVNIARAAIMRAAERARTLEEFLEVWQADILLPEDEWEAFKNRVENALIDEIATCDTWRERLVLIRTADENELKVAYEAMLKYATDEATTDRRGFFTAFVNLDSEIEPHLWFIAIEVLTTIPFAEEPERH